MNEVSKIEVPVTPATAAALSDSRRLEAVGRLIDRLVRPGTDDPFNAVLLRTSAEAQDAGLTEEAIATELAAYNAQGRT